MSGSFDDGATEANWVVEAVFVSLTCLWFLLTQISWSLEYYLAQQSCNINDATRGYKP